MKAEQLGTLIDKHGGAHLVDAINEAMKAHRAEDGGVQPITLRQLYDCRSRTFRPVYAPWMCAALLSMGYSRGDIIEVLPQLKPYFDVAKVLSA